MLKGVSITIDNVTVHFVTPDVALVDAVHTSDSYVTPEDGVKHENERQIKTYLIVKRNGKWLLVLDQNTSFPIHERCSGRRPTGSLAGSRHRQHDY